MRSCVYNEHWETVGGGEKLAASYAEALRSFGDVTLVGHRGADLRLLEERLDVDLTGIDYLALGEGAAPIEDASTQFDLFVNCSYLSKVASRAPRSIYVVQFPERPPGQSSSCLDLLADHPTLARTYSDIEYGTGFYPPETERGLTYRWTTGDARVAIHNRQEVVAPAGVRLSAAHCPPGTSRQVTITVGDERSTRTLGAEPVTLYFAVAPQSVVDVRIESDRWSVDGDPRVFGVQVLEEERSSLLGVEIRDALSHRNHVAVVYGFLDSYDRIVAISDFTRDAIRDYWGRDSVVVHPAVRARASGTKRRLILSVGRFFSGGHSKKQLELVHAFRRLVETGGAVGWELMLIGGSSHRDDYASRVRDAAAGLPITVVENGTGREVEQALAEASIYWHGAGLDESLLGDRVRFEHFGISVVEAMSAGCVPIVYGVGGPSEIVVDGENGLHFFGVDELVEQTLLVTRDAQLRERLASDASRRAADFSDEAFRQRVRAIVGDLVGAGTPVGHPS